MNQFKAIPRLAKTGFVNPLALALTIVLGLVLIGAFSRSDAAGQKQQDLEYGVTYTCPQNNNYEFKVLSCDDKDWCQVFIANKYSPNGGNVTGQGKDTTLSLIKRWDCTVKGRPPQAAAEKDANPKDNQVEPTGPAPPQTAGECPSDENLKAKSKPSDAMELKSKRAILAGYQKAVDAKQYWAVGITFDGFQIGPPHTNIRGVLFHETAPVGTQIYPIKTKFTVCQRYDTEIKRDVMDGRFECFKDNFGDWDCATATGHRTINTTYEKAPKWKAR
jgi:hypothetical protein